MPGEIKESTVRGRVTWLLRLIRIDASFEEQELKWRVRIAWKSFGSEPKKEVTHGEENTDREETRKEQRVESSRGLPKVEKRVCRRKKQLWKAARQLRRIWKKGPEKRLKKAQKAFYKKLMRDLKKFNRKKTVKNRRRRIRIEKKEEKTGRFEKIKM